jgi:hypothetical protein
MLSPLLTHPATLVWAASKSALSSLGVEPAKTVKKDWTTRVFSWTTWNGSGLPELLRAISAVRSSFL